MSVKGSNKGIEGGCREGSKEERIEEEGENREVREGKRKRIKGNGKEIRKRRMENRERYD